MTEAKIRDELLKLTVGKGGKQSYRDLAPGWEVSMWESERETATTHPYVIRLRFTVEGTKREQKVYLLPTQVHTRTRSMWKRDSVWRLTPEAAATFATQIAAVMARVAAGRGGAS
jgi:hypothetical protein